MLYGIFSTLFGTGLRIFLTSLLCTTALNIAGTFFFEHMSDSSLYVLEEVGRVSASLNVIIGFTLMIYYWSITTKPKGERGEWV